MLTEAQVVPMTSVNAPRRIVRRRPHLYPLNKLSWDNEWDNLCADRKALSEIFERQKRPVIGRFHKQFLQVLAHPAILGYTVSKTQKRRTPHLYVNGSGLAKRT